MKINNLLENSFKPQAKSILQKYLAAYKAAHRSHEACDVNFGDCARFAWDLYKTIPGLKLCQVYREDSKYAEHAFVFDGTKYYDSCNLNGVRDWRDLDPEFKRKEARIEILSPRNFRAHWRDQDENYWKVRRGKS